MAESTEHPNGEELNKPAGEEETGAAQAGDAQDRSGFANPVEFLSAELDRIEKENGELKDRVVRAHAEMENLRKRTQKEISDAREFSIAGFAREMIAVSDNLKRALESVPENARKSEEAGFKALIEGVEMTERSMALALEKHGVRKIEALNDRFDPNLHQAMYEIPNAEVPQNTVLQVIQDGYVIGTRCLRPAMVGVSRGGPKQAPAAEGGDGTRNGQD